MHVNEVVLAFNEITGPPICACSDKGAEGTGPGIPPSSLGNQLLQGSSEPVAV